MTATEDILNPFPGLRPFSYKDRKYFFGRGSHISEVVEKISKKQFTAITGSSGSGKSSLINAGIIPSITEVHSNRAGSSWRVISLRPGLSPIENLGSKLAESLSNTVIKDDETGQSDIIFRLLRNNPDGLTECLRLLATEGKERILLVIDQFEDLFLFKRSRQNRPDINECESFVELLVEAQIQKDIPINILLAIDSDYLEETRQFPDLAHLIHNNNYILPEMSREDMQVAILEPTRLHGVEIDTELAGQLLNDIIDKAEKLPLLQYSLKRIWEQWVRQKDNDRPVSLEDYQAVGGIDNALIGNLEETYEELSDRGKLICEKIFKAITEKGMDNREISIPVRIADIAYITGADIREIIKTVERFRRPDRSFLFPLYKVKLNPDTLIELTHESLMRFWPRLQEWMLEESESVILYKHLAKASKSYQQGHEPLLNASWLQQARLWQEKHKPSFEWARRFNPAFEMTMQYIIRSQEEYDQEEMAKKRIAGRVTRYALIAGGIAVLILAVYGFIAFILPVLMPGTPEQRELAKKSNSTRDEQPVIAYKYNNELIVTDPIMTDQAFDSINEEKPADRITAEERAPAAERRLDEMPVSDNQLIIKPSVSPAEEVSPPSIQPDPEEERAREEAMRRRMVSSSQTLASISQKIEDDPDLKALLIVQSQIFNERYNRASYNPDIYSGLFASIKDLYGPNYNAFKGHTASVNSLVFRPNSSIFYSASSDGRVMKWDLNDEGKTPETLIHYKVLHNKLAISPNAQWLAAATDGMGIKVFDTGISRPEPLMVNWGNNRIVTVDFYPDSQHILFAGSDNEIVKYNFINATSQILAKSDSEVLSLSVSPDGETIVAGTRSGQVIIFRSDDNPTGQIIHYDQGNDVHTVSFNNNGTRVAAGSLRGEVRILEASNGNLVATLRGHSARVVDVKFCPENRFIASASFDGTIHLWNAQNLGARPVVLSDHGSWVQTIAFNTPGDKMVSGSRQESRLLAWSTDANEMTSMVCAKVNRNLTTEEWNQYVGEDILYMESCP